MRDDIVPLAPPMPLQIEQLEEELERIQQKTTSKLLSVEEYIKEALAFLEQDIADPALEAVSRANRDIFTLRANEIGLALANRQAYHYAAKVYEALLSKVEEYTQNSGKARHLGVIKVNLGIVYILAGNLDAGISLILETTTRDDVVTYGVAPGKSYALTLLRNLVLNELASFIALWCDEQFQIATGFPLSPDAVSTMANHYDPLGEVTLVSLIPLMRHPEWQKRASTQYGRVRVMDGLRWLSVMLESMVIFIGTNSLIPQVKGKFAASPKVTLWDAYQKLFGKQKQRWWNEVVRRQGLKQADILRTYSEQHIVQKYQQLLSMPENNRDELLSKTVLLSYLTRNLSAHYLELPALVINQIVQEVIKYQLLAQLLVFDWTYCEGHFTQLSAPGVWPRKK